MSRSLPLIFSLARASLGLHLRFSPSRSQHNPSFTFTSLSCFMAPAFEAQGGAPPPQAEPVQEQAAVSQNNAHFSNYESRITIVGSGNWGSVASKLIASNTLRLSSFHGIYYLLLYAIYKLYMWLTLTILLRIHSRP